MWKNHYHVGLGRVLGAKPVSFVPEELTERVEHVRDRGLDLQAVRHQGALVVRRDEAVRDSAIQHAPGSAVFVVRENRFGGRSRSISGAPMRVVALCLILFARTAPNRALLEMEQRLPVDDKFGTLLAA